VTMGTPRPELRDPRGDYGFDGGSSGALAAVAAGGLALAGLTAIAVGSGRKRLAAVGLAATLPLVATMPFYLHATRRGKFAVWADLLAELPWRGDERVLDVGCGRGAVLGMVAKLVPRGRVVGLDLWAADQTGNSPAATRRNLALEGVDRSCVLTTGDMLALPFADASFDRVVSSLAIHNVDQSRPTSRRRLRAIDEAARVLKPGGKLLIVDLAWTPAAYAGRLRALGMDEVRERKLGWRFWYGPWLGANLVTAVRPPAR
jgi:arsenite methyltransferase